MLEHGIEGNIDQRSGAMLQNKLSLSPCKMRAVVLVSTRIRIK